MKIISTFKDYYDFMAGKYGVDSKIVYNRVPEEKMMQGVWGKTGMFKPTHIEFPDNPYSYTIHFCGTAYIVYYVFGDWFFGEGIEMADPSKYPEYTFGYHGDNTRTVAGVLGQWKALYSNHKSFLSSKVERVHGSLTTKNDELNCPVVYGEHKNVRLSDFNFGKVVPPEDAFIQISNWLSREKKIIDKQSDKEKIVSHGFDLKTSFRNM